MGVARLDDGGSYVRGWLRRRLIEILEIGWRHHRGRPASPGGPLPSGLICGLDAIRRTGHPTLVSYRSAVV
jgi:hypothetical protein